ncbi:hypothetical protein LEA_05572, partial [human gut metagenome]
MLGFSPFKKHANKFNYIPRYYDPEKEAREQRRAELRGERAEDAGREYYPPDSTSARSATHVPPAMPASRGSGRTRVLKMVVAAVFVMLFIYLLYPKLASSSCGHSR